MGVGLKRYNTCLVYTGFNPQKITDAHVKIPLIQNKQNAKNKNKKSPLNYLYSTSLKSEYFLKYLNLRLENYSPQAKSSLPHVFINKFSWNTAMTILYILFMDAFTLQRQN
jgi:hypothetical protein